VNRDRKAHDAAFLAVDVMTAGNTQKLPALPLDARKLLAGNGLQTAISMTRPGSEVKDSGSTERQPSNASRKFSTSLSKVSP
jgi:hypothetical protein